MLPHFKCCFDCILQRCHLLSCPLSLFFSCWSFCSRCCFSSCCSWRCCSIFLWCSNSSCWCLRASRSCWCCRGEAQVGYGRRKKKDKGVIGCCKRSTGKKDLSWSNCNEVKCGCSNENSKFRRTKKQNKKLKHIVVIFSLTWSDFVAPRLVWSQ